MDPMHPSSSSQRIACSSSSSLKSCTIVKVSLKMLEKSDESEGRQ